MTVTNEQFLRQIHELQLVPLEVLKSTLTPAQRESLTPGKLAELLISSGVLTRYQVDCLLDGNGHKLVLGAYVIKDLLGCGGIGRVYRAQHRMMQRDVAVKVLSRKVLKKRSVRKRFQREMQVAARLAHPNLVMAFDAGEQTGEPYLVMEYIQGPNLQQLVKDQGPLDVMRTVDLLIQISRGLEYAHGQGIIHRDIKPANLMIDSEGTARILDLGLAQYLPETEVTSVVRPLKSGAIVGTPDFMSPEQSLDHGQIDERTDIYSLGCTLYYLLTGGPMFEGDSLLKKIFAHRNQVAPSLSDSRDDVPHKLETIYRRMTAKNKEDRYSSASELRQALELLAQEESETPTQFATGDTKQTVKPSSKPGTDHEYQPVVNWPILLVSTVTCLVILLAVNQSRHRPQETQTSPVHLSFSSQSPFSEPAPLPSEFSVPEMGFALEFDSQSQVELPEYVFDVDHVLIIELEVTPLLSVGSSTRSVFSHTDSQLGWRLQIQNDRWNLCLGNQEFPLVQLNSVGPVRWGLLASLSIVVHPGYAALYLDDRLQAEWEGEGNYLPARGKMSVGRSDSAEGFVGKIQSIALSKAEHLLVDENGRRLLPESREIIAEYRFEEGEGVQLGDSSTAERHGLIEGAVWSFSD